MASKQMLQLYIPHYAVGTMIDIQLRTDLIRTSCLRISCALPEVQLQLWMNLVHSATIGCCDVKDAIAVKLCDEFTLHIALPEGACRGEAAVARQHPYDTQGFRPASYSQ